MHRLPARAILASATGWLLIALLAGGCSWLGLGEPREASPAATPTAGTGVGSHSPTTGSGAPGPPAAIPDPLDPLAHPAGEEVAVPGATVVYLGITARDAAIVARLRVTSGELPESARLLTETGEVLMLLPAGDVLESEPFGSAAKPPAPGETITLAVGETLVAFEIGKAA